MVTLLVWVPQLVFGRNGWVGLVVLGAIVLVIVTIVHNYRNTRDRQMLAEAAQKRGGVIVHLLRVRRQHPFPDSGRGWWAWRVDWQDSEGARQSWALTTREGLKDWRD